MSDRREFILQLGKITAAAGLTSVIPAINLFAGENKKFDFKISLAQWSLHKALFSSKLTPLGFPITAKKKFGIEAVEYVNQFFKDKAKDQNFLKELTTRCKDYGVKSLLIMVDGEGELADENPSKRNQAVENHYKWVEAAKFLNCHSIRVNLHGSNKEEEWLNSSVESLSKLTEFSSQYKINIIVENHGGFSCNGQLLTAVMKQVNNKYCGTLPDFGNFCVRREKGDLWESPCIEWYDRYKGVKEMLPFAKGVSAKSHDFDKEGNEIHTDFRNMLQLVKEAGYKGYIGVEYEGEKMSEEDGIRATIKLLEKIREEMN